MYNFESAGLEWDAVVKYYGSANLFNTINEER
jgi:hypothetical protein